jgi:hypothetical protein
MTRSVVADELDSVTEMLLVRHPDVARDDIKALVHKAYRDLAAQATVETHLIPLTLNRCRKHLTGRAAVREDASDIRPTT